MIDLQFIKPEDAERISEIAYRLFFEVYPYEPEDVVREFLDENQSPESIRAQMNDGIRYAFITLDGETVGYVALGISDGTMTISKLYLFEDFRGRGVGSETLELVESFARRGCAYVIRLEVNSENAGAIRLYVRKGYAHRGRVGLQGKRLVMEKILKPDGFGISP